MSDGERANVKRALAHLIVARDLLKLAHAKRPLAHARAALTAASNSIYGAPA